MRRALLAILVGAGLLSLGFVFFSGERAEVPALPAVPASRARAVEKAGAPLATPAADLAAAPLERAERAGDPAPAPRARDAQRLELWIELVQPDGAELAIAAHARLEGAGGEVVELRSSAARALLAGPIAPGRWRMTIEALGHRHASEELDLALERCELIDDRLVHRHEATLWPAGWIAVCMRTPDGRSFSALAKDLGHEPKRFFWRAFDVRAAREPLAERELDGPAETVASFVLAPGYHNVEIASGIIGALLELAPRPWWAGLWLHGAFVAEELVTAGATEVVFELDAAVLDARLARVRFALTERDSGRPVLDARATLKADDSAHRRADLSNQPSDASGRFVFERVVPGQHELAIERPGNLFQRRITLGPGEDRDLGELALGMEQGLALVVQNPAGEAVTAWIEIAPYQPGAAVDELYPPNLCRLTDGEGRYLLPVPDGLSVVRARPMMDPRGPSPVGTRNVLVDPLRLPPELRLEARPPREVRIELALALAADERAWIEDDLGLVIAKIAEQVEVVELVPGKYRLQRERASEHTFVVGDTTDFVRVP